MIGKDTILCIATVCFLMGFSWYSYDGYQSVVSLKPFEIAKTEQAADAMYNMIKGVTVETINKTVEITEFSAVIHRNPFSKVQRIVKKILPKLKVTLPKIKKVKPKKEVKPSPLEPEEKYFYRGKVILGGKPAYVVDRQSDKKTYFLKKGDKTRDFIVLDVDEKKMIITDYNEKIQVLKVQ